MAERDRPYIDLSHEDLDTLLVHGNERQKYDAEQEYLAREGDAQERLEQMHDPGYVYDLTHESYPEEYYGEDY
jgi:hypothetical protein